MLKEPKTYDLFFEDDDDEPEKVILVKERYLNDNVAILMFTAEDGEYYADVTVNLGEKLPDNMAYVDVNNSPWLVKFLKDTGIAEDTGITRQAGYWKVPLYKFDMSKID